MTKEQQFFIQILSDHLNGRETKCNDDHDWTIIHQYARKHQVSGIIYAQAKQYMPQEIQQQFFQETLATYYCASNRMADFDAVQTKMNEQNIPYFVVKGPAVASLFPDPKLRVMGDIDLVVKSENREQCHDLLLEEGYKCESKYDDREWQYFKNNMELELHDRLVYEETVNEEGHDLYFNDCWKHVKDGELDWNFHLIFLIFHLRKHFMNSGVGFRQFMDLAVVAQKKEIDWKWLEDHLKSTSMYTFAQTCYGFVDRWFGIPTPIMSKIDDVFLNDATEIIFNNGVFGFDNKDNKISASVNEMRNSDHPRIALLCQYLRQIFPSWDELSGTRVYGYLRHSKLLLPIAWLHRWCRLIIRCMFSKEKVTNRKPIASMQEYDRRMIWMKNWGLLEVKKN